MSEFATVWRRQCPPENPATRPWLGRTLRKWFDKIPNFHLARVTNGPLRGSTTWSSGSNRVAHRAKTRSAIKHVGFGFHTRELPDQGTPLCRQAELAGPGLDRRPM